MTTPHDPASLPPSHIRAAGLAAVPPQDGSSLWLPTDTAAAAPAGKLWTAEPGAGLTSEVHFEARIAAMESELLDTEGLDKIPQLRPLIGDLLHMNTLARVIGPSGTFKSFVLLDMCGHVGTGMRWHGQFVQQGTVVYLVAEGAEGIRKRVRAWEQHHGLRMDNVRFLPRPVQAMSPEWGVLTEVMRRLKPVLIVVDTQARVTVGIEENSNTEMGRVVDRLERLREATAACVSLVHHTGHLGEHGRGASAVKGALHSELKISRKGDRLSNYVLTVASGKQKDEDEDARHLFGMRKVSIDGEFKPDGRPVTSLVLVSVDAVPDREPAEGTVEWIVARLDAANVPVEYGRRRLAEECQRLGFKARAEKLTEAARIRKERFPDRFPGQQPMTVPDTGTEDLESADQTGSEPVGNQGGLGAPAAVVPSSFLGREPAVPHGPMCVVCETPLDPEWASRGHNRHVAC
ncbi:AAA family ATPase [Streptomyces sp. NPDC058757]|uniref:AAA family ATPase n=1 Tax=Streptomyces sp. NPDC058757 TaxID=3346626 RepID=UPI00369CEFB7